MGGASAWKGLLSEVSAWVILPCFSQILQIFALTAILFPSFTEATTSLGESGKTRAETITGELS